MPTDIPPPPEGFSLDPPAARQKPVRLRSAISAPQPPEGFTLDGEAVDGDTFSTTQGQSVRLYGADAPELNQQGWTRTMSPVAVGRQAQAIADGLVDPFGEVGTLKGRSYGRPVAPITQGDVDVGESLIRSGNALATPSYLKGDERFPDYMEAERLARQNRLGVHGVYTQDPADYRANPSDLPDRETVARWWDSPTPFAGLRRDIERGYAALLRTGTPAQILDYAKDNGFTLDPTDVAGYVKDRDAGKRVSTKVTYADTPAPLTNPGDGVTGAVARGVGDGVLPNLLDETGALVDSLGLTLNRENVWNSDRRWADIWANNTDQNRAIIGYDEFAHPYARLGGEIAGGLVLPFGAGARTVPQLAKVGGAYGAAAGFGGGDTLPERLIEGTVGAGGGAVLGAAGGKALEYGVRAGQRLFGRGGGRAVEGAGEAAEGYSGPQAGDGLSDLPGVPGGPPRLIDRLDMGPAPQRAPEPPVAPIPTARPARDGRAADWIDINDIPPPPPGYTLDGNAARAMDADALPSVTAPTRQPDYLEMGGGTRPLLRDPNEAEMRAATAGIEPRDVLPIPTNEVGSVEELAAKDAGRFVEAKPPNERSALTNRTVRNFMGVPVPKVGPTDLIGFLRLRGGLKPDPNGELNALGLTNAARKGMDFVGQEARFGPLVSEATGKSLDDAAFAAWEAGYFPELSERPDIDTFLQAVRDHTFGQRRRFLPEDLAEIDAHDALRAERYDIEQQRFMADGPLYRDRSVPADEAAPFPPVEAYEEWPAEAVKRAGNINLDKLDTPQDIRRALVMVNNRVGFDAATRGRVTQAETERLASELGMTPDALLARRKGQAFNAEEALAARQILAKSGNELVNLARRVQRLDHPGDEDLAAFQRALVRHAAIQEQVSGATAEAGRALQQFRMAADSRAVTRDVLSAVVTHGGGKDRLQDAARVLIDAVESGPGVFNAVASKALKPKFKDKLVEVYINALLSGPQTHAVNMLSNTLTSLGQLPEHAAAVGLGAIRRAVGKGDDAVLASEVGARAFGLLQGAKEGFRLFANAVRTGQPSDYVSKVEGDQFRAISGLKGEVIRVPTRLLNAEDELFKGIARRMELNGLAVRQAHKEGLRGEAAKARIAELSQYPTDEMLAQSMDYARYLTFQRKLGPGAQKLSGITQDWPVAKLFLPFVRTPTNLLKFAVERSPAAPLLREWKADWHAGGARRDLAVARMMIGTGVGMAIYEAALAGKLTGSAPTDPAKARLEYADGWQPYSIRIGDKWYSYKRLDPFSTTLGVAADLALLPEGMSERQREDKVTLLIASIMGNLANKTWLSGLSDITGALSEPERKAERMIQRLVGAITVPTGVAQIARTIDPVSRETDTVGEYVQSRIPGLSDNLLPRRDVWGEPITSEGGVGPDIASPVWQSTAKDDPVNRALLEAGISVGNLAKKIGGRELSPAEYDRYQALAGPRMKAAAGALVASPDWAGMDEEEKQEAVSKAFKQARAEARAELFSGKDRGPAPPAMLPPPPGFSLDNADTRGLPLTSPRVAKEGVSGGVNVYEDLQKAIPGVRFTSGFRDYEYNQRLKARGYQAADNTTHMNGDTLDMLPPPGKSLGWLRGEVARLHPDAELLVHDGHLHGRFPGYYGAPVLGGARGAGVRNPFAGMPPPPAGFKLDAR